MVGNILPSWVDACPRLLRLSIVGLFWSDLELRRLQKKPTKSKIRVEPEQVRGENLYKPHRAASHQPPATGCQRNKSQSVA
jgi:hypothetical protein